MTAKMALDGLKVADFSWFGAGPICAEHFATYGATVVRVESETHIDSLRTIAPFAKGKTGYNVSGYFNNFNAGKLSIQLNLNTEKGQEIGYRIIEKSDVFLTNWRPVHRRGLERRLAPRPALPAPREWHGPRRPVAGPLRR